jgi:putative phage-type endonuclease
MPDLLAKSIEIYGEPPTIGHALPTMHDGLGRDAWLEQRTYGIGASEAATALGIGRSSRLMLYQDKQGITPPFLGNYHTERGHALEQVGLDWFERETGKKAPKMHWSWRHPDLPWMLSNYDGWVFDEGAPVEVKAPGDYVLSELLRLMDGEQICPVSEAARYYAQLHHEMIVTGATHGYLVVLPGTRTPVWTRIERDQEFCKRLVEAERSLWEDHIIPGIEPEVSGPDIDEINRVWRATKGDLDAPATDARLRQLLETFEEAEAAYKALNRQVNAAKRVMKDAQAPLLKRASVYGAEKLRIQGGSKRRTVSKVTVKGGFKPGYSFTKIT